VVEEEDPRQRLAYDRTLLANERTFAAWIRTGLSVAAVGLAAGQLLPEAAGRRRYVAALGVLLVVAGIGIMAFGAWRFAAVGRDLAGAGSPHARAPTAIYALTALVALLLAGLLLAL
jgi:putative membrane protein